MANARAVTFRGAGGVEVISIEPLELRAPGPGEILVEVAAAGLNRADLLQRRGFYPAPAGAPANIPGLELSGIVSAVGAGVTEVAAGDRVMAITGGGAMATHVVLHEREVVAVPHGLELTHAAAIPEVFFTAYDALFARGRLALGETLIVHAVGSGVGTAAMQLARLAGARVIGTSRTRSKLDRCVELGLEHPLLVTEQSFARAVGELTRGALADVILDTIGAAYLEENLRALATSGRLVMVGLLGGASGTAPLAMMLAKRAEVIGTVLRSRPLEQKIALAQEFSHLVLPRFESGALTPIVDDVMPMEEIARAHERMAANETFGKLVMAW